MKKLYAKFAGLPPEVRLLVAMAGLGTPFGVIFVLQRYVFRGMNPILLILGLAVVVGVLCLLGWLVSKMFGRGSRKRQKKLETELASGAESGKVSMSLRAAVKSNNEKFFSAIKEMRKLGISIYDLPWYVVIGDSGCGKTKLINEGGLTFSTGKPEGYQLGTLNYNWWFTEDAIFVDMAGRLCNPQDDSDHREWESFLKTVAMGRKGYPVNGVLLCVSAEHLLQDPPEKHEADANTMLERLRDMQNKLGVTFATYLVITKCDKILGFMPFFDRAERDITIKNQIFGFSRAGDFHELYDPEKFGDDFGAVYERLNELRLRRLNDDVDPSELGLAYSFPEEFRQIKDPLQTYVRTLFPMIKNPRAVKNLIFRGIYFTSATQQGGLILRHLSERLGRDAANQFQPLESLYPRPRPHFVKELLFRKVFPEHGLVFRNEQEVVRNRKLARVLMVGSGVLGVLLLTILIISGIKFGGLISEPRQRAEQAPQMVAKPVEALTLVSQISRDVGVLRASIWPSILSLGIGADRPVRDLTKVQVALFEESVLRPLLAETDQALRTARIVPAADATGGVPFEQYLAALEQYVLWYGCAESENLPEYLDYEGFEKLAAVMPESPMPLLSQRKVVLEQAKQYFLTIHAAKDSRNPARILAGSGFDPPATVRAALANVHVYAERYATLSEESPDPAIREWMRVRNRCARIGESYQALLAAGDTAVETQEQLDAFRTAFDENYAKLAQAMQECAWQGERGAGFLRIPTIRDAIRAQRKAWMDRRQALYDAYAKCGVHGEATPDPTWAAITALIDGNATDLRGLDRVLADSIQAAGLADRGYFPGYFGDDFDKLVREVDQSFAHIIVLKRGKDAAKDDEIGLTDQLRTTVRPVLDKVHERLATLGAGDIKAETAAEWVSAVQRLLYPGDATAGASGDAAAFAALDPAWQAQKLQRLDSTYQDLVRKGEGTVLLRTMETRLGQVGTLGFGELAPEWRTTQRSAYYIPVPTVAQPPTEAKPTAAAPPVAKPAGGPPPLVPQAKPPSPAAPATPATPAAPTPAPERQAGTGTIPNFASPEFLNARAMECVPLLRFLADFSPDHFFSRAADTSPPNKRCSDLVEGAWKRYCEQYVQARSAAYKTKTLAELQRVGKWDSGWETFAAQFRPSSGAGENEARNAVRDEFQPALAEILHAARWATYMPESGWWLEQKDDYYGTHKRIVASAYEKAVTDFWTVGAFARNATAGAAANDPKPWDTLAGQYAGRWVDWCNAVGKAATLPRKFNTDDPQTNPLTIPWSDIPGARTDNALGDERITGEILAFQQKAQNLLSAELSNLLRGVQKDFFADQVAYDGWPYVNKPGEGLTALETVQFEQFAKFLLAVQRAETAFAALEKGLPDEPNRISRKAFFKACTEWRDFLGLTAQGGATPLEVTVWTEDPLGEPFGNVRPDDTGQHFYKQVCLTVGLRIQESGDKSTTTPLCFQTTERGKARSVRAVWEWARGPELQELTFALVDGLQPEGKDYTYPTIKAETLGKPSPLGLCAYLHRYGRFADGNWVVSHAVDLPARFKEAGRPELIGQLRNDVKVIGEKFIFQLPSGRPLPGPVPVLVPASVTPAGG